MIFFKNKKHADSLSLESLFWENTQCIYSEADMKMYLFVKAEHPKVNLTFHTAVMFSLIPNSEINLDSKRQKLKSICTAV